MHTQMGLSRDVFQVAPLKIRLTDQGVQLWLSQNMLEVFFVLFFVFVFVFLPRNKTTPR